MHYQQIALRNKEEYRMSDPEKAGPPAPEGGSELEALYYLEDLQIRDRSSSLTEFQMSEKSHCGCPCEKSHGYVKSKPILKSWRHAKEDKKNHYHHRSKKENSQKRIKYLQTHVEELKSENMKLKRIVDGCPNCVHMLLPERDSCSSSFLVESLSQIAGGEYNPKRSSRDSLEFQNIDFSQNLLNKPEMNEKAWVLIGIMMVAMGSKVTDIDGTMDVFKIVKDSVDSIRKQVEKCEPKVNMEIYTLKQEMKSALPTDEMGFDPFYQKIQKTGFELQGIKLDCVDSFQLFYEQKINFSMNYESLLTAIEYLKQHSWVYIS